MGPTDGSGSSPMKGEVNVRGPRKSMIRNGSLSYATAKYGVDAIHIRMESFHGMNGSETKRSYFLFLVPFFCPRFESLHEIGVLLLARRGWID